MFEQTSTQPLNPFEIFAPPPAELRPSPWRRLPVWVAGRGAALVDAWRRRQANHELSVLDARALRDIGLTRGMIEFAVRGIPQDDVRARHLPTALDQAKAGVWR